MAYRVDETPHRIVIRVTDAVMVSEPEGPDATEGFFALCQRAISTGKKLLIDFRGVQFMSSAIIVALVLIHKTAKESRVDFRIFNVSPNMMEIFRITRLTRVFRFGADDDDDDGPDALGA
ncbi:MAG: STAS domain-containing protein, partial [Pirellulaceae bacterium]